MLKDIKTIKKDILAKFREINAEKGDVLPHNWLTNDYLIDFNSFERKNFQQAIKELTSQGLITHNKHPSLNLKLTEKGANLIN